MLIHTHLPLFEELDPMPMVEKSESQNGHFNKTKMFLFPVFERSDWLV
jgi:hypothetical protein